MLLSSSNILPIKDFHFVTRSCSVYHSRIRMRFFFGVENTLGVRMCYSTLCEIVLQTYSMDCMYVCTCKGVVFVSTPVLRGFSFCPYDIME